MENDPRWKRSIRWRQKNSTDDSETDILASKEKQEGETFPSSFCEFC